MPDMVDVLLAFGSNLGNREKNITDAWRTLGTKTNITPLQLSPLYETEPVGGPASQGLYVNAVGIIRTFLLPLELLKTLQQIESAFGRIRLEHWGARTLDIDILLYGNSVINTPELTIPHPEMLYRQFVLQPAQDIAADWVHPVTGLPLEEHRLGL